MGIPVKALQAVMKLKKKLKFKMIDFEIQKEQRRRDVTITPCTPFEHLFKPVNECLPHKGHRSGGVASLVAHNYYQPKPLGYDPDDLPDWA